MIRIEKLCKTYDDGKNYAVLNLDLHVIKGELLILLGESGCGKTTTLKSINRLVEPSSGRIIVEGSRTDNLDPVKLRRKIGYVFQGIGLFPHLTAGENIRLLPDLLDLPEKEVSNRVKQLLEMMGLPTDQFINRFPSELSGGQQQRVGVARALITEPKLMLMDEPFGALDPITRNDLQEQFLKIKKQLSLTVVMVTHDITEALLMADRIGVMKKGYLVKLGTPHELLTNSNEKYIQSLMSTPIKQVEKIEHIIHKVNGSE